MVTQIRNLRPVLTQPEHDFGRLLAEVLSPSRPLHSEEFLRSREEQLSGIKKALYQPGRHVLIHGFRGVGKSSLAQTAAFGLSREADPVIVGCEAGSTFQSVVRDIFNEAFNKNPQLEKKIKETGGGWANFGFNFGVKSINHEAGSASEPASVNEAVRLIGFLCDQFAPQPVFVVDEFDQIRNFAEQENFTNLIKQISDKHIPARFIFCGIGESVDAIMRAHGSADRYFHTVGLGQLPWEARFEIVTTAADRLGIEIDESTIIRIARISDGFPHYVHLLSEKLFWRVFEDSSEGKVDGVLFEKAMADTSAAMEMKLKGPYEKATQKYSNDYESVLWSAADGHELRRRSSDIYDSHCRIMEDIGSIPLDRAKFNQRINSLKQASHACILTGTRAGWYEFTEKVIRGYVRLRAEQEGVLLEADHPAAKRRRIT